MAFTRKSIADSLDSYDAEISALQDSKRQTLDDYRAQLADKGFAKAQIKAEVEALKRAMRRRRAIAKTSEAEVDQADDLADEIFVEITSPAPRATLARENIEQFPPHGPETGELTQIQEQPESEQNTSVESRERQTAIEVSKPEATPKDRSLPSVGPSGTAATISPSPSNAPRMAADDEAAQANPNVVGTYLPSAADLPGSDKAPEAALPPSASGAVLSEATALNGIPAFLRKNIADYRPNCIHPDACAATGLTHCYVCRKAMEAASETEAAA